MFLRRAKRPTSTARNAEPVRPGDHGDSDVPHPQCINWDYDLTGNVSGRCPECGVKFSRLDPFNPTIGTAGHFDSRLGNCTVQYVINSNNMIVIVNRRGQASGPLWLQGIRTSGLLNGQCIDRILHRRSFQVIGNKKYATALGLLRTVKLLKVCSVDPGVHGK